MLVIYGAESQEELRGYLDCLYSRIQETVFLLPDGEHIKVSLSGGYLFYPEYTGSSRELVKLADEAMYLVKKSTKGRFARYQEPDER